MYDIGVELNEYEIMKYIKKCITYNAQQKGLLYKCIFIILFPARNPSFCWKKKAQEQIVFIFNKQERNNV